ncbi:MAG: M4 family metallopeptidase, partial [Bacteroidota bacterium]
VQATRAVPQGRVDAETGVLRAAYRLQAAPHAGAPEQAARAFLQRRHADFGMQAHARDLQVVRAVEGAHSRHVTFQQTVRGVPVYGRYVQVNLDLDGRATMVLSDYASYLDEAARRLDPQPTLDETAARAVARQAVSAEGAARTLDATLVVLPNKPVQLAWRVIALPRGVVAEWEVLVDAHRGDVIQLLDVSTCGGKHAPGAHAGHPHAPTILASEDETARALNVPGLGLVFDPDPLTTAGVPYGAPFVDQDDANIQAVNDQLFEVVLNDLTQDQDGLYRLSGPFVRIENAGSFPYQPPAEASPDGFRYARSDDRFEAVNAYYHIDKSQRYVQSLEVGRPIRESPVTVNPHGFGNNDDSRYLTNQHLIIFGTGGVDDAEDAHVIWHEYAHALLEGSAPNLLITLEGRAFHEGWADYWAASYARSLVEDGVVPPYDWRDIFRWDSGDGLFWSGRRLDRAGTYPDDTRCDDSPCGDVYPDGLIWATTLMEVYDDLGRTVTDRLALASHGYLAAPVTFRDAAEALIQADRDLYGGAHTGVLLARLGARGYVQPTAYGPVVQHTALPAVEQLGGMVEVEVLVNVAAAPIAQANLIYATNPNATPTTVPMKAAGEGRYTALIDLPDTPGEVTYYIEVTDELDLITRLPDQAPATLFRFAVGPDNVAPLVTHQVPTEVTTQAWPVEVLATVEDNLGVDSVWVDYTISRPADEPRTGTFVLRPDANNATLWRGAFPATIPVSGGTQVAYQILAQDAAAQANRSIWPAEGRYTFAVTNSGIVRAFSFEEAALGITETGAWSRGVPTFGVQVARTGDGVMATEPAASYPAAVQLSSLTLPPVDLSAQQAYLVFWHWYDFEHDG